LRRCRIGWIPPPGRFAPLPASMKWTLTLIRPRTPSTSGSGRSLRSTSPPAAAS
jgi:hypothetical protein